jgi:hypothetical protein
MRLSLADLSKMPVTLPATLVGAHVIVKPDADRVVAVILSAEFRLYTLYISQSDASHVTLEVEPASDPPHPQSAAGVHHRLLQR